MKTTLIFDFDGTIADSFDITVESINKTALKFKIDPIPFSEKELLRGYSFIDLIKKYQVPKYKVPLMAASVRNMHNQVIQGCNIIEGMAEIIIALGGEYNIYILSSNSKKNIEKFFRKYPEVRSQISDIFSVSSFFGKHRGLAKLLKKLSLSKDEVVYIGDELRDVEACEKIDLEIISVTWGFNTSEKLQSVNSILARAPSDIPKLLKSM